MKKLLPFAILALFAVSCKKKNPPVPATPADETAPSITLSEPINGATYTAEAHFYLRPLPQMKLNLKK
ncbi:MAG: hypothetical protein H0X62_12455 [Bacteroidetes bacterium]|nr:hypothetical protein [Bacteroidota bacterium]